MPTEQLSESALRTFERSFDSASESEAIRTRNEFIQAYPIGALENLTVDDYVTGKGTASFCNRVEAKTKKWALIQGATAKKFGIYYGRTKHDPQKEYRFSPRWGDTATQAFENVKNELLLLLVSGEAKEFQDIEKNRLSQMFKAKILSLYYPDMYLNVCSKDHIRLLAAKLGLPDVRFSSEYQNLLLDAKLRHPITRHWSNPKFMEFLYATFIDNDKTRPEKEVPLGAEEADQSEPLDDEEYIPDGIDRRKLIERQIRERRGQQAFRDALRGRYGDRCLVSGCRLLAVVEAAHISPYRGEDDNHVENGLLLRSDVHTLFDLDLLGIEPDRLVIELHPGIAEEYGHLAGVTLSCPEESLPSREALRQRYERFCERRNAPL